MFFDAGLEELLWVVLLAGCVAVAVGVLALERRLPAGSNLGEPAD